MTSKISEHKDTIEEISRKIGRRAENLFLTKQLWCSAAVLVVLNRVLNGDLPQDLAIRLTTGQGHGMGGSGCICGGLSGAVLAIGLFLGNGRLSPVGDKKVRKASRWLHDEFKKKRGATCCRVLLKNSNGGRKEKYRSCARHTAVAADLCARLILREQPNLIQRVDWDYLNRKDRVFRARIRIAADNLSK